MYVSIAEHAGMLTALLVWLKTFGFVVMPWWVAFSPVWVPLLIVGCTFLGNILLELDDSQKKWPFN